MATKEVREELRGVITNGPNLWALVLDGLVYRKMVLFEVEADDGSYQIQASILLLEREGSLEGEGTEDKLWAVKAFAEPPFATRKKLGFKLDHNLPVFFYARAYSTKNRDGEFLIIDGLVHEVDPRFKM